MDKEKLRSDFALLRTLADISPKQRVALLQNLSTKQAKLLTDASYNCILNEAIKIDKRKKANLKKHIGIIKVLGSKKVPISWKKKNFHKHQYILKQIADVIAEYFSRAIWHNFISTRS